MFFFILFLGGGEKINYLTFIYDVCVIVRTLIRKVFIIALKGSNVYKKEDMT